jgi:hypothetical protein
MNGLYIFFRRTLLLIFPILLLLFQKEFYKCADKVPSILSLVLVVLLSLLLTHGKGVGFNKWFRFVYPLLVLGCFFAFSPLFYGSQLSHPNAKIKATMGQMRSTAEMANIESGSYAGIRESADFNELLAVVRETRMRLDQMCFIDLLDKNKTRESPDVESLLIAQDGSVWCYRSVLLNDPASWCVDSVGYMGKADEGGCSDDNLSCKIVSEKMK